MLNKSTSPVNTLKFILTFLAVALWCFSFRAFLLQEIRLTADAGVYFEHIDFYLSNISRGVYPLWESTRHGGVPEEFFLRRIGSFNPIFFIILILDKIGFTYIQAYLSFLVIYFFIGITGFYLLTKRIFDDANIAFLGSLLLAFSSIGTKLFDSYIHLAYIPMIWFFYFLISFNRKQEKHSFLGIILTLMILLTTYIPFYFLMILFTFIICILLFYFKSFTRFITQSLTFFNQNKILTIISICACLLALLPGALLYTQGNTGEVVFPVRHHGSTSSNQMGVEIGSGFRGGILLSLIVRDLFFSLKNIQLDTLYIPFFTFLMLLVGGITRTKKRIIFFVLWGMIFFLIGLTNLTPIYQFLYNTLPFFKFFRNLHFFIWMILLPLIIIIALAVFRSFLNFSPRSKVERYSAILFMTIVHISFAMFLNQYKGVLVTSYLTIGLSFLFFMLYFYKRIAINNIYSLMFLFILITLQPMETFHYLHKNLPRNVEQKNYRYPHDDKPYLHLNLLNTSEKNDLLDRQPLNKAERDILRETEKAPSMYMGAKWYHFLINNFNREIIARYLASPLIAYDHVESVTSKTFDRDRVEEAFARFENTAFISSHDILELPNLNKKDQNLAQQAQIITSDSQEVQILKFDVNFIKLKTNFTTPKFLVYNDNFHSRWHAYINGKKAQLWRANIAFKGLWVPAGENTVYMRYGEKWQYLLNYTLLLIFNAIFIYLVLYWVRSNRPNALSFKEHASKNV